MDTQSPLDIETPTPIASRTLGEAVLRQLREEILAGAISPGQALSQERLATRFGVSRVPIREALRHLAAEGLVTMQSHHSAVVTSLDRNEVEELIVLAGALDLAAVNRGVPRLTDDDLRRMEECVSRMESLRNRPTEWLSLNLEFHLITTQAAGWPRVEALVIESRRNIGRYVRPMYERCVDAWHAQHQAIYAACSARDVDLTKRLLDAHWAYTVNSIEGSSTAETPSS